MCVTMHVAKVSCVLYLICCVLSGMCSYHVKSVLLSTTAVRLVCLPPAALAVEVMDGC